MVLVEVSRKAYLASLVPVIVNAILNEHQIIVDIVAFVNMGDFPRSRLGEKQRGKLLAGWVTRKMRTIAQFAIRDLDPEDLGVGGGGGSDEQSMMHRHSMVSARSSGGQAHASSLRNVEQAPRIMEHEEFEQQQDRIADMTPTEATVGMPDDQKTPTGFPFAETHETAGRSQQQQQDLGIRNSYHSSGMEKYSHPDGVPPPVGPKPVTRDGQAATPQIRLPGVDGREDMNLWGSGNKDDDDSWEADAIMHMNLTGDMASPR